MSDGAPAIERGTVGGASFRAVGIAVGHATDADGATGVTVVLGVSGPLRGGVAVVGRATGTRELHALSPDHLVDRIDAIMLTGGSAYGLDAAAGVMRWMEERGRGLPVPGGFVPIVPAAVIFDLAPLGRYDARPTAQMAYDAAARASADDVGEGSVGAGTGATVGKATGPAFAMKGGVGCAASSSGGVHVAALAVVNALGDVRDGAGRIIAGARAAAGGFADSARVIASGPAAPPALGRAVGHATTLAVVATNVALARSQLRQLAQAASAALYRRITPTGTSFDGDVVFALGAMEGPPAPAMQVEALAVDALERAIERAVRTARGRDGIPGLGDER